MEIKKQGRALHHGLLLMLFTAVLCGKSFHTLQYTPPVRYMRLRSSPYSGRMRMPSRPGCTCQMTDVGEMRWPLKHGCRADRAARRRYCATRPGLSCVLRRHIYHVRVLTLGHVLRKNKKHGLSLFLSGACSRTWNGYIHPCQIACIVFIQTTAEIPSARGGQRGVFTNRASPCHDIVLPTKTGSATSASAS